MKKFLSLTCLPSVAIIAIGFARYSINAQENNPELAEEMQQNVNRESASQEMDQDTLAEDTDAPELDAIEESLEVTPKKIDPKKMIEDDMPAVEDQLESLDFDMTNDTPTVEDDSQEPIIDMKELEKLIKTSEASELSMEDTDEDEINDEDEDNDEKDESSAEEDRVE